MVPTALRTKKDKLLSDFARFPAPDAQMDGTELVGPPSAEGRLAGVLAECRGWLDRKT